jgi:hypothetical protein
VEEIRVRAAYADLCQLTQRDDLQTEEHFIVAASDCVSR